MHSEPDAGESRSGAQMVQRCATLLKLITAYNRTGMRLVELYQSSGLTRPTTHRILQALVAERLIRQDEKSKKYHLGSLAYEMGLAAAMSFDLRDVCQPFLERIATATGDTAFLTIRSGFDGVCAGRAEGAYPIKAFVLDVGRHRPLNIGAGAVALLSGLQDEEIERIYQANSRRIARDYPGFSVRTMWERVEHIREKGYFINEVLELQDIRALAIPIFGPHGIPVGGLSVSALKKRLSGNFLREKLQVLTEAAREIEAKLRDDDKEEQHGQR
ncbi:helix-turn-helix domain-containing protein [Bordetella petrii]|nr:helix-turn-helix domain-containing protein [Bordetella petrii]